MVDISAGLAALSAAAETIKHLRNLDKQIDLSSLKLQLAELTNSLADARIALADAKVDLNEKDRLIRDLEAKISNALRPPRVNGLLRRPDPHGAPTDERLCGRCFDVECLLVTMHEYSPGYFSCPNCKTAEKETNASRPQPIQTNIPRGSHI